MNISPERRSQKRLIRSTQQRHFRLTRQFKKVLAAAIHAKKISSQHLNRQHTRLSAAIAAYLNQAMNPSRDSVVTYINIKRGDWLWQSFASPNDGATS